MGQGVVGVERQGASIGGLGVFEPAQDAQRVGQGVLHQSVLRQPRRRQFGVAQGVLVAAHLGIGGAQHAMGGRLQPGPRRGQGGGLGGLGPAGGAHQAESAFGLEDSADGVGLGQMSDRHGPRLGHVGGRGDLRQGLAEHKPGVAALRVELDGRLGRAAGHIGFAPGQCALGQGDQAISIRGGRLNGRVRGRGHGGNLPRRRRRRTEIRAGGARQNWLEPGAWLRSVARAAGTEAAREDR